MSNEQEEFDLEKFADLFDTAMSSTNPAVQRAFKNLLLIASLVDANSESSQGPMRKLIEDVKKLNKRVSELEYSTNYTKTYSLPSGGNQWTTGTGTRPLFPPGTIIGHGTPFCEEDMKSVDYNRLLSKWEKKYD